jgi:hypothetical protein
MRVLRGLFYRQVADGPQIFMLSLREVSELGSNYKEHRWSLFSLILPFLHLSCLEHRLKHFDPCQILLPPLG